MDPEQRRYEGESPRTGRGDFLPPMCEERESAYRAARCITTRIWDYWAGLETTPRDSPEKSDAYEAAFLDVRVRPALSSAVGLVRARILSGNLVNVLAIHSVPRTIPGGSTRATRRRRRGPTAVPMERAFSDGAFLGLCGLLYESALDGRTVELMAGMRLLAELYLAATYPDHPEAYSVHQMLDDVFSKVFEKCLHHASRGGDLTMVVIFLLESPAWVKEGGRDEEWPGWYGYFRGFMAHPEVDSNSIYTRLYVDREHPVFQILYGENWNEEQNEFFHDMRMSQNAAGWSNLFPRILIRDLLRNSVTAAKVNVASGLFLDILGVVRREPLFRTAYLESLAPFLTPGDLLSTRRPPHAHIGEELVRMCTVPGNINQMRGWGLLYRHSLEVRDAELGETLTGTFTRRDTTHLVSALKILNNEFRSITCSDGEVCGVVDLSACSRADPNAVLDMATEIVRLRFQRDRGTIPRAPFRQEIGSTESVVNGEEGRDRYGHASTEFMRLRFQRDLGTFPRASFIQEIESTMNEVNEGEGRGHYEYTLAFREEVLYRVISGNPGSSIPYPPVPDSSDSDV